ncbi:MAG: hypothetical protein EPO02_08420, partial [Nitrospirae bacterium]
TDRAAVILGTAKLDNLLYQVLRRFLLPDVSSADELFDGDAPLATFSSRIKLAYRLGLIDKEFARALNLVRKIRNAFAHELSGITLSSGAHRDQVRELVAPFKAMPDWEKLFLHRYFKDRPGPGGEFRAVVAFLSIRLDGLFESVKPLAESQVFAMILQDWHAPGAFLAPPPKQDASPSKPAKGDAP